MDVLLAERTNDKENQETSKVINKSLNAGIPVSQASAFLWSVNCVSLASALWHQSQSDTTGH